jgi:hypothetical protein
MKKPRASPPLKEKDTKEKTKKDKTKKDKDKDKVEEKVEVKTKDKVEEKVEVKTKDKVEEKVEDKDSLTGTHTDTHTDTDAAVVCAEDIDVGLAHMSISAVESEAEADTQSIDVSPVAPHHETWKDIYTPRNSHTTDEPESGEPLSVPSTPISEVAQNLFSDVPSPAVVEDSTTAASGANTPATITSVATKSTPGRRPSVKVKEATPRFSVKEKVQQAATEAKSQPSSTTPGFMKQTTSSNNHLNKDQKEKIADVKWEKRLRKNDDHLSRKVQSSFRDRSNKFMKDSMMKGTLVCLHYQIHELELVYISCILL